MSTILLDPWSDAAVIASRLAAPSARLVLIVGAESWCETCRTLRPIFESLAQQQEEPDDVWLWLDLEEHAEFLDDFIPENLPLFVSYKSGILTHALIPNLLTEQALAALLTQSSRLEQTELPDIRSRLMTVDWAL